MDKITAVVSAITGTITQFGTSAAEFLNDFTSSLVFEQGADGATELSSFGAWGLGFLGISMVLGLGGLIIGMVTRKGH